VANGESKIGGRTLVDISGKKGTSLPRPRGGDKIFHAFAMDPQGLATRKVEDPGGP